MRLNSCHKYDLSNAQSDTQLDVNVVTHGTKWSGGGGVQSECVWYNYSDLIFTHFRKTYTKMVAAMATSEIDTPMSPVISKAKVCC